MRLALAAAALLAVASPVGAVEPATPAVAAQPPAVDRTPTPFERKLAGVTGLLIGLGFAQQAWPVTVPVAAVACWGIFAVLRRRGWRTWTAAGLSASVVVVAALSAAYAIGIRYVNV
jgi:hypothetical protein